MASSEYAVVLEVDVII